MANGKVTNDKIYDLINSVRLELKEDIHQANVAFTERLEQIKSQQAEFLSRQEYNRAHNDLVNRVETLNTFINRNSPETLRSDSNIRLARLEAEAEAHKIYQAQFEDAVDLAQWGRSLRANLKFLIPVGTILISATAALISSLILKWVNH